MNNTKNATYQTCRYKIINEVYYKKYKSNVKLINKYMTSKMCNTCENMHKNLGSKKIYNYEKCKIDGDINPSINIYKKKILIEIYFIKPKKFILNKFLLFYRNIFYKTVTKNLIFIDNI